jgi:hypothetical protein
MNDLVEKAAQAIYEKHVFGLNQGIPIEKKPPWVPLGNSLKQQEARDYAQTAFAVLSEALSH